MSVTKIECISKSPRSLSFFSQGGFDQADFERLPQKYISFKMIYFVTLCFFDIFSTQLHIVWSYSPLRLGVSYTYVLAPLIYDSV